MKLFEIIAAIEELAPPAYQESWDNCGLITGNAADEIHSCLITLDVSEEVVDEAVTGNFNLIISHHPVIFSPLKKITGKSVTERIIMKSLRHGIALYCAHTSLDNVYSGVNFALADKLGIRNARILSPVTGELRKLVTFVPPDHAEKVRNAIFKAGGGHIGNYDQCSFNLEGTGSFRGSDQSKPFVGKIGEMHFEKEIRIETIFPNALRSGIIRALLAAHPYEEVAYDIYLLDNAYPRLGAGIIGQLDEPMEPAAWLEHIRIILSCQQIRYSGPEVRKIKTVACCGGSGSFLIREAINEGADSFVTGDVKYHQFLESAGDILLIDAGHFETEQHTREIFYELLMKKFPTFAVRFSNINTNPIKYF
jgi:dinuclear metal center YbgI/SA1388 family protein